MVRDGYLIFDAWEARLDEAWDTEIASEVLAMASENDSRSAREVPERWADYEVKRARLSHVAQRVRELLLQLPPEATILPEVSLEGYDRRLRGVADLVMRPPGTHRVVDYKTGGVLDARSNMPREKYVRQLQLYAALEEESTGQWPETLHLLPLRGAPVEVDVDPGACKALATEALELLSTFNAACPGPQPASPSLEGCSECPFSARCPDFWGACESWPEGLLAVRGRAIRILNSELNGVSVELVRESGTVISERVLLRNIDPETHPEVRDTVVGARVAATGLREEKLRGTYRVPPWGHLECQDDAL